MNYLHWNEKTITDFSEKAVTEAYNQGYVFTRIGKGVMHQTRSVRIDLSKFELSSENRRILKKIEGIEMTVKELPFREYTFNIGKLGKDFYEEKFGPGIMSAIKVKEMLTDTNKSNFNILFTYKNKQPAELGASKDISEAAQAAENSSDASTHRRASEEIASSAGQIQGYTICHGNKDMLHYSYPFYNLDAPKDTGLGMMTLAIEHAKEQGLKYIYLGSLQRPNDTYKLQFSGLEWFNSTSWSTDLEEVKKVLAANSVE